MQRILALLLCLVVLSGCGTFNFSAFGIGLDEFEGNEMSTDEKLGTILLIGIVVAVGIGGAALAGD